MACAPSSVLFLVFDFQELLLCHSPELIRTVDSTARTARRLRLRAQRSTAALRGNTPAADAATTNCGVVDGVNDLEEGGDDAEDEAVQAGAAAASLYFNSHTADCARLACGSVVALAEAVASGALANGFAAVRPPGHHCEACSPGGFCFLNNVATAARVLTRKHGLKVCTRGVCACFCTRGATKILADSIHEEFSMAGDGRRLGRAPRERLAARLLRG